MYIYIYLIHSYFSQHKNCSIPESEGQSDNPNQKLIYQGIKSPPASRFFTRKTTPFKILLIISWWSHPIPKRVEKGTIQNGSSRWDPGRRRENSAAPTLRRTPHGWATRIAAALFVQGLAWRTVGGKKNHWEFLNVICLMSPILIVILIYVIFFCWESGNPIFHVIRSTCCSQPAGCSF